MLNILDLIPSKDIREHLKKIDYKFSFLDAIELIQYQDNLTMEKRHEMYRDLKSIYKNEIVTIHHIYGDEEVSPYTYDIVDNLIRKDKKSIENIKVNKDNHYMYYYKVYGKDSNGKKCDAFDDKYYSTYDKCYNAMKEDFEEFKAYCTKDTNDDEIIFSNFIGFDKIDRVVITRRELDDIHFNNIYFNENLDVVKIDYTVNVDLNDIPEEENLNFLTPEFYGDAPNFPVPFNDKDLVCYNDDPNNLILLSKSVYGKYATEEQKLDNSIMAFNEIRFDADGKILWLSHDCFEHDWTSDWLKYEYFKGDLDKNKEKIDKLNKADDEYRKGRQI